MSESRIIGSSADLLAIENQWNQLWESSDCHESTMRCKPLALSLQRFSDSIDANKKKLDRIRILTSWENGILKGALPLLIHKKRGVSIAALPNDCWSRSGDLLIHPEFDQRKTIECLLRSLGHVKSNIVYADWIRIDQPRWKLFKEVLDEHRQTHFTKQRFSVTMISVPKSIEALHKGWSKNHRKKIKQAIRRLHEMGRVELVNYDSQNLLGELEVALDIEHKSWKGTEGSSLLANPEMADYFKQLSMSLHDRGHLCLQFLVVDGKAIAFDLGHIADGVRISHKVLT